MERSQGEKISSDWTPEERLSVIASIAAEMAEKPRALSNQVFAWSERLRFVAEMPATFLEANRKQMLYGQL